MNRRNFLTGCAAALLPLPCLANAKFDQDLFCEIYEQWRNAHEQIGRFGTVIMSRNNVPAQSPYMLIASKSANQMRRMLKEHKLWPVV